MGQALANLAPHEVVPHEGQLGSRKWAGNLNPYPAQVTGHNLRRVAAEGHPPGPSLFPFDVFLVFFVAKPAMDFAKGELAIEAWLSWKHARLHGFGSPKPFASPPYFFPLPPCPFPSVGVHGGHPDPLQNVGPRVFRHSSGVPEFHHVMVPEACGLDHRGHLPYF